jgi:ubiquitin-protein ligase
MEYRLPFAPQQYDSNRVPVISAVDIMLDDLENEVEAINSIYGEGSLEAANTSGPHSYILHLPNQSASLKIEFPGNYPDGPPAVVGTHSSGDQTKKGEAAHVLEVFREAVLRLFRPGEVCLYDVIEDVAGSLASETDQEAEDPNDLGGQELVASEKSPLSTPPPANWEEPPWTVSEVIVELKSVFVARCALVTSPLQVKQFLQHLLDTDKKVAKATHNIIAHRIQSENGITFQDCDDDGETAAGGRLLHLLQLTDVWNVMVVVTRWYGGQKLGPARFGIINSVARDALVKGGFIQDQEPSKRKKR